VLVTLTINVTNVLCPDINSRCHHLSSSNSQMLCIILFIVTDWQDKHCISNFLWCCNVPVGNIPYEATEEQLKEIFCQAGPVVSFR